jgi:hypothetical protein
LLIAVLNPGDIGAWLLIDGVSIVKRRERTLHYSMDGREKNQKVGIVRAFVKPLYLCWDKGFLFFLREVIYRIRKEK